MSDQHTSAAPLRFLPAAAFSLETFAEIFTRSFEGYFYPGTTTAQILAERARSEQLDLFRSVVMLEGEAPVGQAVLGLRGGHAWCGGFGVYARARGQGLSARLIAALIEQARASGANVFSLEVLTRNEKAIRAYRSAGLDIRRQLMIYEWSDESEQDDMSDWPAVPLWQAAPAADEVTDADPLMLLSHFQHLHPAPAAWQRDLPSLLVRGNMRGLALAHSGAPEAYLLYSAREHTARILDLAATRVEDAERLLEALKRRYSKLVSVNEPSDSPNTAAYRACGFTESDRQHEMSMQL